MPASAADRTRPRDAVSENPFRIERCTERGRHTLALIGELDCASAPTLEATVRRLCRRGRAEVVLDLDRLEFIDSAGLNAILRSRALCQEHGCRLQMIQARAPVRRVFEITRLADRLPFHRRGQEQPAGPPR